MLLVMSAGILVNGGGPDGYSAAPLNPANLFDNEAAIAVFGAAAVGDRAVRRLLVVGRLRDGAQLRRGVARAAQDRQDARPTCSVIGLGVFYVFVSYMFVTGWGLTGSAQAVADQFEGKYASAFYPLTDKFVGSGLTTMVEILIITSSFACSMAFYNTGSRYLFSLAREGVLPRALGRVHPTQRGPVNASMVVSAIIGVYMLAFALVGLEHARRAAQARDVDAAARRARDPGRAGPLLHRDHPLLPDRRARRVPSGQDADRAGDRLPRDGRRVLSADRQPRGAVGRGRRAVHQAHPVGRAGRVPDRLRDGAVDAPQARDRYQRHRALRARRRSEEALVMSTLEAPPDPASAGAADGRGDQRRLVDPEGRQGPRARRRGSSSSTLHEPPKEAVQAGEPVPREAFIVLNERSERRTYEAVVSLTDEEVVSWRHIEGVQSPITFEEFMACEAAVQADPEWQAAMRKRGVEDFSLAMVDPWAAGYTGEEDAATDAADPAPADLGPLRAGRARLRPPDRGPRRRVRPRRDGGRRRPRLRRRPAAAEARQLRPAADGRSGQRPALPGAARTDLKPIEITQPEGPSFTVEGHDGALAEVAAADRLHAARGPGAARHRLRGPRHAAADHLPRLAGGDVRPLRRPGADAPASRTSSTWASTASAGSRNPLELGCDCLGEIRYFDGVVNDQDGEPMVIPNAICMHEEDVGIGWKHTDFRTEDVEVRRLRRLVISTIATVGNYEYGYFWYLYTDGTIEYEVKLTGVISTGALAARRAARRTARWSRPGLYGPQPPALLLRAAGHGRRRQRELGRAGRLRARAARAGEPDGHGLDDQAHGLPLPRREAQAQIDPLRGRYWRIENAGKVSELGDPVAYKLMPGENVAPMFAPESRFAPARRLHAATTCG